MKTIGAFPCMVAAATTVLTWFAAGYAAAGSGGDHRVSAETLLGVPVSSLMPGGAEPQHMVGNPNAGDPQSLARGMQIFDTMNCSGCHAPNGGGGMGPSLSNRAFIYGSEPANVFLTISQGRPGGMPAWGRSLPQSTIWDLVTYVTSLSDAPASQWGRTSSPETLELEQVPAQVSKTPRPWNNTQRFSFGQKPNSVR